MTHKWRMEKQENSHPPLFFLSICTEKQKKSHNIFVYSKISSTFALANHKGTLAEWLGNGLQNRLRRFESARYLKRVVREI